jgi:uncharacterized membrane protein
MPIRLVRLHGRLAIAAGVGLAVTAALLPLQWRLSATLLAGWDTAVVLYLVLVFWTMRRASVDDIRSRAAMQDEGAAVLPFLTAAAAVASLSAIIAEMAPAHVASHGGRWQGFALGMGTILLSWLFMHTIFALHYAHEFYGEGRDSKIGGLDFPGEHDPDYWDFLYFSFVIAMTSQVSDVQITSRIIRRTVNVHGVLSFFFNLSVLALTVNMMSNLVNPG